MLWTIDRTGNAQMTVGLDTWFVVKSADDYRCIYKNNIFVSKVLAPLHHVQCLIEMLVGIKLTKEAML